VDEEHQKGVGATKAVSVEPPKLEPVEATTKNQAAKKRKKKK
jgi:hypothetical protein